MGKREREEFSNLYVLPNHYNERQDLIVFCFRPINRIPNQTTSFPAHPSWPLNTVQAMVLVGCMSLPMSSVQRAQHSFLFLSTAPWTEDMTVGHFSYSTWSSLQERVWWACATHSYPPMLEGRPGSTSSGYSAKPQPVYQMRTHPQEGLGKFPKGDTWLCCAVAARKRVLIMKYNYSPADTGLGKRIAGNRPMNLFKD